MDILAKLEELQAFTEIIKNSIEELQKEVANKDKPITTFENKSSQLVAMAKAKRAKSRIS